MNRLLSLSLLTLYTTHIVCTDSQNEWSRETEQTEAIIARNKEIEQEIVEFDSFFSQHESEFADGTGIIQIKIILYKDHVNHDKKSWKELIIRTAQSCSRIRRSQLENKNINIQEEIEAIAGELANRNDDSGIITEFTIETSDGIPTKGCCGDNCKCVERYRGNCPCSLNKASNRCLFPQEELPFDDKYQEDESTTPDSSSEDTPEIFEEVDLNTTKSCCCN